MTGNRWLATIGAIGLVLALATPALVQGQKPDKPGKGGKDKEEEIDAGNVMIQDGIVAPGFASRLGSDFRRRNLDGELEPPLGEVGVFPNAVYQSRLMPYDDVRQPPFENLHHPDPCVDFHLDERTGLVRADFDAGAGDAFRNCACLPIQTPGNSLFSTIPAPSV